MFQKAVYTIVIGDTGVGKSSLIRLLTNYNNIDISSGAQSCTENTTFYALLEKDVCFIDTRGTEDSDEKTSDKEILNGIQSQMHDFKGSLCKIVWIVHPADKANRHLRAQVSFIEELGTAAKEARNNVADNLILPFTHT